MDNDLITKIHDSLPPELRSVWMEYAHVKLANISTALIYLVAAWENLDNPTRDDLLSGVQNHITNVLQMVRTREIFEDDEGKNGG